MYCPKCGKKLSDTAKFCKECGTSLPTKKKAQTTSSRKKVQEEKRIEKEAKPKEEKVVLEEERKEETSNAPEKKPKKSKKKLILLISSISLGVLLLIGIFLYFFLQYLDLKKPIEEVWGQKYYVYLKEVHEKERETEAGLPKNIKNGKLGFYQISGYEDPVMVIVYQKNKKTYSNVYYLKDGKVNVLVYDNPTDIEFLYNMKEKEYDYYAHTETKNEDTYKSVGDEILEKETGTEEQAYTFEKGVKETVMDEDGKKLSITEYEETFVEPNVEDRKMDYASSYEEKDLKEAVKKGVDDYRSQEDLVTEKVEDEVKKQVDAIEDKKEAMEEIENKNYTSGIKNLEDALSYELGLYFYNGEIKDYGINSSARVITKDTKELFAKDLKDTPLSNFLYSYLNSLDDFDFGKEVYTEKEIKNALHDMYGNNYVYDHKIKADAVCSGFTYDEAKGGYIVVGGCGGIVFPNEPHLYLKILEKTDTTVTVGRAYVIPSGSTDSMDPMEESVGPYQVYSDEEKTTKLGTVDEEEEVFTTLKAKVNQYKITFDKHNGYYHFKQLKKIN